MGAGSGHSLGSAYGREQGCQGAAGGTGGSWRPIWPQAWALLAWTDPETSQGPRPDSASRVLPTPKQEERTVPRTPEHT